MSAASEIRDALLANDGVTAITSRVYPLTVAQGAAAPYVIFQQVASDPDSSHDGPAAATHRLFQFACFAATYEAAIELRDAIVAALDAIALPTAGNPTLQDTRDGDFDDAANLFRADADFLI